MEGGGMGGALNLAQHATCRIKYVFTGLCDTPCPMVWQVRDEFREDYDEGRGGLGKKHQEKVDRGFDARRRY